VLADPVAAPGPADGGWRRAWDVPVWAHLLALGTILLLLVPVVGTSQSFLADEGAAILQSRSLAEGDGWIVEHPFPEVDPDGDWYPIGKAERGEMGFAPLGKHPAYPLLAAGAASLGGVTGMVLLSLLGTVAAAGLAAALAGRIDGSLVRPALWAVGLASPLLFDGFLVMAHSLGAAFATAAVLATVVAVQERRPAVALLVAPAVAGAVLLRNEALLFAAALALVAGLLALRRPYRVPAVMVAGVTIGAAVVARVLDRVWLAEVTGGAASTTAVGVPAAGESFVSGRIDGFTLTWLTPGYDPSGPLSLALLVMLGALGWCALRARSRPQEGKAVSTAAWVAAGAAVVALVVAPTNVVPGLLLSFPLLAAGLLVLRRRLFADPGVLLAGATAGLFALGVIATQYSVGGTGEWGGRYFALLIPAVVPVLLAALRLQGRALQPAVRRSVSGALVVCSAALAVMAVGALRSYHQAGAVLENRIEAAGRATGDARPVVVTTSDAASRVAWPTFDDHRWLLVPAQEVLTAATRLRDAGVDRFVFVTNRLATDRPLLGTLTVVSIDGPGDGSGRQVLVLQS
jgi:hypothetical protein